MSILPMFLFISLFIVTCYSKLQFPSTTLDFENCSIHQGIDETTDESYIYLSCFYKNNELLNSVFKKHKDRLPFFDKAMENSEFYLEARLFIDNKSVYESLLDENLSLEKDLNLIIGSS